MTSKRRAPISKPVWNVVLRGGPRSGILMHLRDETQTLVEYLEPGSYRRTVLHEGGRVVFDWDGDGPTPGGAPA